MYLSKITLKQSPEMARLLLASQSNGPYGTHQLLWKLFPHDQQRHFVYREEINHAGLPEYYVLSVDEIDRDVPAFCVQSKRFNPQLVPGQRLAFKLRANPTICLTQDGKSKRHDVIMHAKFLAREEGIECKAMLQKKMSQAAQAWMGDEKRLLSWGISLEALPEVERYTQHRSTKKGGHGIAFSSVDYQGVLTLTDPARFLAQYKQGFGRAKAMGCGLMLIRPL